MFQIQSADLPEELISQPAIDISQPHPYLPYNPLLMVQNGQYQTDVDLMLGFNEDEGILITQFFMAAPSLYDVLKEAWNFLGPFALFQSHHTEITEQQIDIATEMLNFYTDNAGVENLSPDKFWNVTDMFTDSFFTFANYLFLKHHLEHSTAKTYQYRFSYNVEYIHSRK